MNTDPIHWLVSAVLSITAIFYLLTSSFSHSDAGTVAGGVDPGP